MCQVQVHYFSENSGRAHITAKLLPAAGARARLLDELTPGGLRRGLGGLQLSCGQLPDPAADGMAVLTQQAHASQVVDCHDCRTTRMTDNLKIGHVSVGQADGLYIDDDDATLEHSANFQRAHRREPSGLLPRALPEMSPARD